MSYIYLQEQEGESSAESYSDIPQYVLSRLNLTAKKYYCNGNETESCQNSQSGTMCEHSTADRGEGKSIAYAVDSLVKTSARQEKVQESTEQEADSGLNLQESLARYDLNSRSWKTHQCSLLEGLDECLETFPSWGMMRNGVLWERTMLVHHTDANECGFWRTPDTSAGGPNSKQQGLSEVVKMFPTPNCSGMDDGSNSRKANKRRGIHQMFYLTPKASENGLPENKEKFLARMGDRTDACYPNLSTQVWDMEKKTYPTPTAHEFLSGGKLTPQMRTARLNPNWVEWLMGWIIGWTDLKPLATDKFQLWLQQLSDC